jgi:hypothetical protein
MKDWLIKMKKQLYEVVLELWHVGKVALDKLSFLPDVFVACYMSTKILII